MAKCFFNDCKKDVNERSMFCKKKHDLKEREAAADLAAIFSQAENHATA